LSPTANLHGILWVPEAELEAEFGAEFSDWLDMKHSCTRVMIEVGVVGVVGVVLWAW